MPEPNVALPSILIENRYNEDGKVVCSVMPIEISHDEEGVEVKVFDANLEDDKAHLEVQLQMMTSILSGLMSSIMNIEDITGEKGKTMGHAINWLNTMYVDVGTKVVTDEDIEGLDKQG